MNRNANNPKLHSAEVHPDGFTVTTSDYVELIKYFEGQGTQVKGNMLKVVPWLVTVATVLMGYALERGQLFSSPTQAQARAASVFLVVALCILLMAGTVTYLFAAHMQRNWTRSDYAYKQLVAWRDGGSRKQAFHPYAEVLKCGKATFVQIIEASLWLLIPIMLVGTASVFLLFMAAGVGS